MLGSKRGQLQKRDFGVAQCGECRFGFVTNPWEDYAEIYSAEYYAGRGADPMVDYVDELENPDETVRLSEWRGLVEVARALAGGGKLRWLDYGSGNGGVVRYARSMGIEAVGFEEGWIAERSRECGIPVLSRDKLSKAGQFTVITAIEVLEHIVDPVAALRHIKALLAPGGVLFCTTGNAANYRGRLLEWQYVIPEIHVSFFEPSTLALAMKLAGLTPEHRGYLPGHTDIIRSRVLKNMYVKRNTWWHRLVPWPMVSRLADRYAGFSQHPIGWNR